MRTPNFEDARQAVMVIGHIHGIPGHEHDTADVARALGVTDPAGVRILDLIARSRGVAERRGMQVSPLVVMAKLLDWTEERAQQAIDDAHVMGLIERTPGS